jgi:hypothetical protein
MLFIGALETLCVGRVRAAAFEASLCDCGISAPHFLGVHCGNAAFLVQSFRVFPSRLLFSESE